MTSWTENRSCLSGTLAKPSRTRKHLEHDWLPNTMWKSTTANSCHMHVILPPGTEATRLDVRKKQVLAELQQNGCPGHYSNIGSIIFHPQMWDGIKNAKHEFYKTERFRKWWRLHLNNTGRELMWGNIMKIFNWTQDVQLFQALLRATTISKEII